MGDLTHGRANLYDRIACALSRRVGSHAVPPPLPRGISGVTAIIYRSTGEGKGGRLATAGQRCERKKRREPRGSRTLSRRAFGNVEAVKEGAGRGGRRIWKVYGKDPPEGIAVARRRDAVPSCRVPRPSSIRRDPSRVSPEIPRFPPRYS